jgi:hypothetical protein
MKDYKPIFLILAVMVLIISMLGMSFCTPYSTPGNPPYGDDDDDVTGDDIYEDDDSFNTASSITVDTETQSHTIYNAGDVDYITFYGEAGIKYRVKMSNIKGFEPEMSLFSEAVDNDTSLVEMKNTGTYTDEYDWWGYDSDHNYNEDEVEAIIFIADNSGNFYIRVKDIYDAHGKGSYDINVYMIVDVGTTNSLVAEPDAIDFQIDVSWGGIAGVDGYYLYRTEITQDVDDPNYSDFTLIKTLPNTYYEDQ